MWKYLCSRDHNCDVVVSLIEKITSVCLPFMYNFQLNAWNFVSGGPQCVTQGHGFHILCLEQLVLRNVLVAINHIRLDNWQVDPPTNK